jgi:hypothetical protein
LNCSTGEISFLFILRSVRISEIEFISKRIKSNDSQKKTNKIE